MLKNFIEQTINGLQAGSIYALIALGYTMVYGIVGLINFAHGDILMIGSYIVLVCLSFGIPFIPALVISIVFCAILGVLIDFFAYRPLRNAPKISALITAIGMSFLLESVALIVFGANPRVINTNSIPSFLSADSNIKLGAINISILTIFVIAITLICMYVLNLFIKKLTNYPFSFIGIDTIFFLVSSLKNYKKTRILPTSHHYFSSIWLHIFL